MSFVPKDVVILPESTPEYPDRWVAMNVFARTSLGISSEVLAFLGHAGAVRFVEDEAKTFVCWEIEYFSNEDGLLADPSRFRRDPAQWRPLRLGREALEAKLKAHCLLVDDECAYRARFQPKRNLLDFQHFGNFHQQHGQHMMLVKREDPGRWWIGQKFTEGRRAVRRDSLYGAVQWDSLADYFERSIRPGATAVDVGCGIGIYSNLMASCGAVVRGVDPSEEYLAVARQNAVDNATFFKANIGEAGGLDAVPDGWADIVFMSDALLFYFVPYYPGQKADIQVLLAEIRRILKPDGIFVSVEPHPAFYQNPWLGDEDRPFTILTEYAHRSFGIVPPGAWLAQAFAAGGFVIRDLFELGPADYFKDVDARAYHFAREFPLWQLIELTATER